MSTRTYIQGRIAAITDAASAEMIMDMLEEEGVLHLGFGNVDVDAIVAAFKKAFKTTKTSKFDRYAANRLAMTHGKKAIVGIIEALAKRSDERFAPTVNNIVQLEDKLPSVQRFLRSSESGVGEMLDVEV